MIDKELLLPNGNKITFNDEQHKGLLKISDWLYNKNNGFPSFTLAGYAGTGKSTIIKKIIDQHRGSLVVSAPTHKAKKVVMRTTDCEGETLQALLGLRPDVDLDDFNPNSPKFNPIAKPKMKLYRTSIIDEASMINEDLMKLIKSVAKINNTKILYVGDPAQIPPIGEKISVVFLPEFNHSHNIHQLTKVERQVFDNPLGLSYDTLRNNLHREDGGFERKSDINDRGEGIIFFDGKKDFRKNILDKFSTQQFKDNVDFMKIIAWRNDTVIQANETIRRNILGDGVDILEIGDFIMGYRTITNQIGINIIENSADYKIVDKQKRQMNEYDMWGYPVKIKEDYNGEFYYNEIFVIDHNDHDNLHQYADMHDYLKENAKGNKKLWKIYYKFRRNNVLMKTINTYRDGEKREFSEIIAKDIDYAYAITGHKSQGSTYQHVAVLEDDIDVNTNIKEKNQIKYVALTRPVISATVLTSRLKKYKYF